jgi:hypothetical protein
VLPHLDVPTHTDDERMEHTLDETARRGDRESAAPRLPLHTRAIARAERGEDALEHGVVEGEVGLDERLTLRSGTAEVIERANGVSAAHTCGVAPRELGRDLDLGAEEMFEELRERVAHAGDGASLRTAGLAPGGGLPRRAAERQGRAAEAGDRSLTVCEKEVLGELGFSIENVYDTLVESRRRIGRIRPATAG